MVWVHGGAFVTGTAAGPVYDASRLAREHGVVVVTLNYRVGALGFLGLGPPNLGLQDQVAALRWVRDEIAAFGGDPTNVTVFGESAGGGSIASLLAMPSARGLFAKAIVQSAAPEGVLSRDEAAERAALVLAEAGLASDDLDGLRRVELPALLAAQSRCQEPGPRRIGMYFAPVVDGEVLPRVPDARGRERSCGRGSPRDRHDGPRDAALLAERLDARTPGRGAPAPDRQPARRAPGPRVRDGTGAARTLRPTRTRRAAAVLRDRDGCELVRSGHRVGGRARRAPAGDLDVPLRVEIASRRRCTRRVPRAGRPVRARHDRPCPPTSPETAPPRSA